MKHHVSAGIELMDTLRAVKCKASCIPESGVFSLPNLFSFRVVLFGYQQF